MEAKLQAQHRDEKSSRNQLISGWLNWLKTIGSKLNYSFINQIQPVIRKYQSRIRIRLTIQPQIPLICRSSLTFLSLVLELTHRWLKKPRSYNYPMKSIDDWRRSKLIFDWISKRNWISRSRQLINKFSSPYAPSLLVSLFWLCYFIFIFFPLSNASFGSNHLNFRFRFRYKSKMTLSQFSFSFSFPSYLKETSQFLNTKFTNIINAFSSTWKINEKNNNNVKIQLHNNNNPESSFHFCMILC